MLILSRGLGQNDEEFKMAVSREEVLQSLIDTLELCSAKVKEGTLGQVMEDLEANFSLDDFNFKLGMTFKAVSKEATKLVMAFSKPPEPKPLELEHLLTGFETVLIALLTVFHSLPPSKGKLFHKRLQSAVVLIVEDAKVLINSIKAEGCSSSQVKNKNTGALWEHCDVFDSLPKNNKDAVLQKCHSTAELVKDAIEELGQAQQHNGLQEDNCEQSVDPEVNELGWSGSDRLLVHPSVGLIKACRSCLKKISSVIKTNGEVTSVHSNLELDNSAEILDRTSPCVDDLVLSLYAPMNQSTVAENATKLADNLRGFLTNARSDPHLESHYTVEADSTWLDFLSNAVDHNLNKLMDAVPRGGQDTAT